MANTIRVHELATELRKSNRQVSDRLRKLEIPAKTNLSSVTQEDANRVRESFGVPPVKIEKPKKKATAKKPAAKKAEKKPAAKKAAAKKAEKKPAAKKAAAKKAEKKPAAGKPAVGKAAKPAAAKPAAKKTVPPKPAAKKAEPRKTEQKPATQAGPSAARPPAAQKQAAPTAAPRMKPESRPAPAGKPPVAQKPAARTAGAAGASPTHAPQAGRAAQTPPKQGAVTRQGQQVAGRGRGAPAAPSTRGAPGKRPAPTQTRQQPGRPHRGETAPAAGRPPRKGKGKQTLRVAPADRRPDRPERKLYRYVPRGRAAAPRARSAPSTVAPKLLRVPSGITVKDFAQKAGLTPGDVIKKMMGFGEMLTLNQPITDDALRLLSEDLGVEIRIKAGRDDEPEEIVDEPGALVTKPPVVTVMGHVDHGKTLLLDAIRKTDVVGSEHGGITQHIGAYQVKFRDRPITFIDTPGHASFTAMRARGANMTDIAVLVVAADDGVMPQTVEALDHALEAEVPVIVAVNKIDKPDSEPGRVRQQLSEKGLIPEEWGGETVFVDVSAKTGDNIEHLLEMIQLMAEIQELKANPDAPASGVIVEARLDKARGPVATVLVQRGTAHTGDVFAVGAAWGRIRAMFDDKGVAVEAADPAFPVEILGLAGMPMAGDEFRVVEDEKKARQISDKRKMRKKLEEQVTVPRHISLENLFDRIKEGELKELKVVLKADTQGSLEAIVDSLVKISRDEVKLQVIHSGVGGITETDVMLAMASDAIVLGFNVRPDGKAAKAAELEEVEIRTYQVIYQLTEDMEAALVGMLAPIFAEEVTGRLEVRQTFRVPGSGLVAGSYVLEGEINRNSRLRVVRDGIVIYDGKTGSLRRFKEDVKSVSSGFECGVGIEDFNDVKESDILEAYQMKEVPRQ